MIFKKKMQSLKKILLKITPLKLLSIISLITILYIIGGILFYAGHAGMGMIMVIFCVAVIFFSFLIDSILIKNFTPNLKKTWLIQIVIVMIFFIILAFI